MTTLNEPTIEPDRRGAGDALRPSRSAAQWVLLWLCKLGAAGLLGTYGFLKLYGYPAEVSLFQQLGMEPAGRLVVGALEMGAAGMMLIRQSTIQGALLGLGVMTGALIAHFTVIGLGGAWKAALVALLCISILVIRRHDASFIRNLFDR